MNFISNDWETNVEINKANELSIFMNGVNLIDT